MLRLAKTSVALVAVLAVRGALVPVAAAVRLRKLRDACPESFDPAAAMSSLETVFADRSYLEA